MRTPPKLIPGLAILAASLIVLSCGSKVEKGRIAFQQCGTCHNADSTARKQGPGLKGLFQREKLASNGKSVTDASVRAKIDEGGNGMPAYKDVLSEEDKDNVIAYLKSL